MKLFSSMMTGEFHHVKSMMMNCNISFPKLNAFFNKSGAEIIFDLNALNGRPIRSDGSAVGAWDSSNAESLIRYTVKKGYQIYGWELGNEPCGSRVGVRVAADQYASDTIVLGNRVQEIYKDVAYKPIAIAPGGFFDVNWFTTFVQNSNKAVDAVTHHIYNLGPGVDDHLTEKILNPSYLDGEADTFSKLQSILKNSATSAAAWVGEAGGACSSGRDRVSNAFVYSFWYLDKLRMSAAYGTKAYCWQSLIGENYGLLNTTTFVPHPNYYWHFLPLPVIKKVIDSMTYAKLNVLHWHIVDTQSFPLEIPSYPKLWTGAYSSSERYTMAKVAEIVRYAQTRGIHVLAEIDVPRHAESWGGWLSFTLAIEKLYAAS